jgi:hypothetical protein
MPRMYFVITEPRVQTLSAAERIDMEIEDLRALQDRYVAARIQMAEEIGSIQRKIRELQNHRLALN